jgi:hypothetical protein
MMVTRHFVDPIPLAPLKRGDMKKEKSEEWESKMKILSISKSPFLRGI